MQLQGNGNNKSQLRDRNTWASCGTYPSQKQTIDIINHKQRHYGLICCCCAYGIIKFFFGNMQQFVVVIIIVARLVQKLLHTRKNTRK